MSKIVCKRSLCFNGENFAAGAAFPIASCAPMLVDRLIKQGKLMVEYDQGETVSAAMLDILPAGAKAQLTRDGALTLGAGPQPLSLADGGDTAPKPKVRRGPRNVKHERHGAHK